MAPVPTMYVPSTHPVTYFTPGAGVCGAAAADTAAGFVACGALAGCTAAVHPAPIVRNSTADPVKPIQFLARTFVLPLNCLSPTKAPGGAFVFYLLRLGVVGVVLLRRVTLARQPLE